MKRSRLAAQRKAAGLSQEELAHQIGVDRSTIVRWEGGERTPQPWQRPNLAQALGVSLSKLDELLASDQPTTPENPGNAAEGFEQLRETLSRSLPSGSLTVGQIDDLHHGIEANARHCLHAPPLAMVQELVKDLSRIRQHIDHQQPPTIQQGLYRAGALLAVLIADELMVLGNPRQSRAWHGTAQHLADQSTDDQLRANVRALAALLPLYYGDPIETVRLAEAAEQSLDGKPILASVLAPMYKATALAQMNAANASSKAFGTARQRIQDLEEHQRSESVFGLTEPRWQFYQGRILSELGRVDEAWDLHEQALARYPAENVGDPALILFDRSTSLIRSRQVSAGCELAEKTLIEMPEQHRTGIFMRAANRVINAVTADQRASAAVAHYRETVRTCATAGTLS